MRNKEFAAKMRSESVNWMDLMVVSKKLWLEIADRIESSPDPLAVQQESRKGKQAVPSTAGEENSWFRRLFFQRAAEVTGHEK